MQDRKLFNLEGNKHYKLLEYAFMKLNPKLTYYVMDAGSGKTSLSSLLNYFYESNIDAYVYPGDNIKIESIRKEVISNRYSLIEQDICTHKVNKKYNLVLAHLILGEAQKYGHSSTEMIDTLLNLNSEFLLICEHSDDPNVDFKHLLDCLKDDSKYIIIHISDIKRENKFSFDLDNKEKIFTALIRKLK